MFFGYSEKEVQHWNKVLKDVYKIPVQRSGQLLEKVRKRDRRITRGHWGKCRGASPYCGDSEGCLFGKETRGGCRPCAKEAPLRSPCECALPVRSQGAADSHY